jgi:flagellar basal-body rod modification protein FlgD
MDISNIGSSPAKAQNQQQKSHKGNQELGKNAFLKLLVAQMKNQDPTQPMDGRKLATQLAQFNSVEQLIDLNDTASKIAQSKDNNSLSLQNTMAASLAGKKIKAMSDRIHLGAGKKSTISYRLNDPADKATIKIIDSDGNTVRTDQLKNIEAGDHTWTWKGKSDSGKDVPEGTYKVDISAQKGDNHVNTVTYQKGKAKKVRYTTNGVKLMVNDVPISMDNVKEIGS